MIKKAVIVSVVACAALLYSHMYIYTRQVRKPTIQGIMSYDIDKNIIARCQKDFGYNDEDMLILERELKRYLALSLVNTPNADMCSKDVDNLWHTFILFTKEYTAFGKQFVDGYVHHIPKIDTIVTPEKQAAVQQYFLTFVKNYEETFGEEIHDVWLLDMCEDKVEV